MPVTEIASIHGMSEAADAPAPIGGAIPGHFVRDLLLHGARVGFIGSGDTHDGHPGLGELASGQSGLAGSTIIRKRVQFGGQVGAAGHLEIGDDVHISAGTMVTKNLKRPGQYTSIYPLEPHEDWLRNAAQLKRLAKLSERVAQLEKLLDKKLEQIEETD